MTDQSRAWKAAAAPATRVNTSSQFYLQCFEVNPRDDEAGYANCHTRLDALDQRYHRAPNLRLKGM